METEKKKTWRIDLKGTSKMYLQVDEERQEVKNAATGERVMLPADKWIDFVHTARILGINIDKL